MRWTQEPYGDCGTNVALEFVDAPGSTLSPCSFDLIFNLSDGGTNPVQVRFERRYENGFHYKITHVGRWRTSSQFHRSTRCIYKANEDPSTSNCGKVPSPLREPYNLE